jgi:bacterioferritin-associated ferredoxin
VIVCSCNVLSEAQILESLHGDPSGRPRSAGQAYRCLGCAPRCGRCIQTVRALAERAHLESCKVGCPSCPAQEEAAEAAPAEARCLIAAE